MKSLPRLRRLRHALPPADESAVRRTTPADESAVRRTGRRFGARGAADESAVWRTGRRFGARGGLAHGAVWGTGPEVDFLEESADAPEGLRAEMEFEEVARSGWQNSPGSLSVSGMRRCHQEGLPSVPSLRTIRKCCPPRESSRVSEIVNCLAGGVLVAFAPFPQIINRRKMS